MNKKDAFNLLKKLYNKRINKIDDVVLKNNNWFIFNNIYLDGTKGINQILEGNEIKELIDSKRTDEKILERIALLNSLNDTSDLNWYEGKTKINLDDDIKKISDDFCDNILLYFIDEYEETKEYLNDD